MGSHADCYQRLWVERFPSPCHSSSCQLCCAAGNVILILLGRRLRLREATHPQEGAGTGPFCGGSPRQYDVPPIRTLHRAQNSHVPSMMTSSEPWACLPVGWSVATTVYWSWVHSGRHRASVSFTNRVPEVSSAEVTTPRALQLALESCSSYRRWIPVNSWPFSTETFPTWHGQRECCGWVAGQAHGGGWKDSLAA